MTELTADDRELLLVVADVLIPATDTMPALRDADCTGEWLGRAYAARADAAPDLLRALRTLASEDNLTTALHTLHARDRATFDVLAMIAAGAYYMVPRVRDLIGYPGQVRNPAPIDQAADELSDEIFEGAMNYRGGYRSVPDSS